MSITKRRKKALCQRLLSSIETKIGFVDVGSGGPLKDPWNILSQEHLKKFNFEPTSDDKNAGTCCISNRTGKGQFFIAQDERSSSLHEPSLHFINRFGQHGNAVKETIEVQLTTLDEILRGQYDQIDLIDFNVEGHDFQALQGAVQLLEKGFVKLIKTEFELTEVWKSQGWFSDIDVFLRAKGFELANIEVDYARPYSVKGIHHRGEPVWGKAFYVPKLEKWPSILNHSSNAQTRDAHLIKAIVLYTITDLPGRAYDVLDFLLRQNYKDATYVKGLKEKIQWTFNYALADVAGREFLKIISFPLKFVRR